MNYHEFVYWLIPLLPKNFPGLTDGVEDGVQILIDLPAVGQLDAVTSATSSTAQLGPQNDQIQY